MDPQPSTVTVNGAELSYVERGSGDAVVFVHGSLGDYRAWGFQMEPFAQRYRAIAISRRRHWPNAWPEDNRECSVEVHAVTLPGSTRSSQDVIASRSFPRFTSCCRDGER